MTVIVFDGNTLAADMRAILSGTVIRESKIRQLHVNGTTYYVAQCGSSRYMARVIDWMERNLHLEPFDRDEFPLTGEAEKDGNGHVTVVCYVDAEGKANLHCYEADKYPEVYDTTLQTKHAFGTGAKYALGAMAVGVNAVTAVKVAMMLNSTCGEGYQGYDIRTGAHYYHSFDMDWNSDVAPKQPDIQLVLPEQSDVPVFEEVAE